MPKIKLSQSDINSFATDIYKILCDVPLFYLYEVLELSQEQREKDGEDPDLDVSDSDESSCENDSEEDEEDEVEDEESGEE